MLHNSPPQAGFSTPAGQRVLLVGWPELGIPLLTGIIGKALRLREADARLLQCDGATRSCEVHPQLLADIAPFIKRRDASPCPQCQLHAAEVPTGVQLPFFNLSAYLRDTDYQQALEAVQGLTLAEIQAYSHAGMNLGEHVRTTLHRSFLVGTLEDDEVTRAAGRRLLATAIQLAQGFERLLEDFQPQVAAIYHGIYLMRGTCLEVAKKRSLRVVCWDEVYLRGGIQMSHGDTYHHEFRQEPWQAWEDLRLTPQQEARLEAFLAERGGGMPLRQAHSLQRGKKEEVSLTGRQPRTRRSVVLFTNISWDGRVKVDSSLYDGPAAWVIDTLRHLANRNDLQVIVRIHPHEVWEKPWKVMKRFHEEIRDAMPELPQNVTLILPENRTSSYALAELADVVIVYSTLMGLEALAMGKQVIITGDAYYSNKGFGLQPATREEYLRVLERLEEIEPLDQESLARVRRYAYYFFFRRWLILPIPPRDPDEHWLSEDLRELKPGSSNALDRACNGILHGTPFHVGAP